LRLSTGAPPEILDPMRQIRTILLPLAALAGALLPACATNPVTGDQDFVLMSESDEIHLGQQYNQQILEEMPVYDDPALAAYVDAVGQRVARNSHRPALDYHFTVLDSDTVNAFALPGGYIYITRGIMAYLNSEAELAAVLGHEIGHVTARHSVRQQSAATVTGVAGAVLGAATGLPGSQDLFGVLGNAMLSGYGRDHELESDRLGAEYLARSGYDPQAMLEVIGVLKNQELYEKERARREGRQAQSYHGVFASHPENDQRLQEVVGAAGQLNPAGQPLLGRESYLAHLEGLAFGPSASEGIVAGSRFYHLPLDFALAFAEGWTVSNQPERLLAVAPGQAALLEVTVTPRPPRVTPRQFMEKQGAHNPQRGESLDLNGLDSYTAVARVSTNLGERDGRFVVLFDEAHAFLFTGVSRQADDLDTFDKQFLSVARSFHRLDEAEKSRAAGLRLHLIDTTPATRLETLARESPVATDAETRLRLLNGLYPDLDPNPGQTLKIVR
jgi:predicted Zn-dependent protease